MSQFILRKMDFTILLLITDIKQPVEAGRIVRAFDPCVSCATHIIGREQEPMKIEILI